MRNDYDLPDNVRQIAAVIGRERALLLVGKVLKWDRGGNYGRAGCLYVPRRLTPGHKLIDLAGQPDALRLVEAFGGEILHISPCAAVLRRWRNAEAARLAAAGVTRREVAEIIGVCQRHLSNLLRISA